MSYNYRRISKKESEYINMGLFQPSINTGYSTDVNIVESTSEWLEWYSIYFSQEREATKIVSECERQQRKCYSIKIFGNVTDYANYRARLVGHLPWRIGIQKTPNFVFPEFIYNKDFTDVDLMSIKAREVQKLEKQCSNDNTKNYSRPLGIPNRAKIFM